MGVERNSSKIDIRKQYFESVKKYHPDVTQHLSPNNKKRSDEQFLHISQAYEILNNKEKKHWYDQQTQAKELTSVKQSSGLTSVSTKDSISETFKQSTYDHMQQESKFARDLRFDTDEEAYQWWKYQSSVDDETLRKWREKAKQHPFSEWDGGFQEEFMRQHTISVKQRTSLKFVFISMMFGLSMVYLCIYFMYGPIAFLNFLNSKIMKQLYVKWKLRNHVFVDDREFDNTVSIPPQLVIELGKRE